ncbi:TonB-linked outer membrane protein, SusC/RagA family [Porphyromonadaceae bacterium KH3R12]|nr:TonB-linked outer membrane protein, SusC/RagA family [Porphyromonadaceae bacterium KH3R12]
MKINISSDYFLIKKSDCNNLIKIMKICLLFLFAFTFQLMALNTNAQDAVIELKTNSVTIGQLINEIERQTDYLVVYSNREVDTNRKVNFPQNSDKVSSYLNTAFLNTDIGYNFENDYIVLSKKAHQNTTNINRLIQIAQQQGKTVRGTVTDSNGEPVIGATIIVKDNPSQGTVTDIDGNFILSNLSENAVLQITYVGMKAQEVNTSGRSTINVIMEADIELLDEVVVVGYGTMKKSDLTGSLSQIKEENIKSVPSTNVMQALSGRAAGVHVIQNTGAPGASINVRVRGSNSIQGSNEPLYVIDGFPVSHPTALNNSDIESIEILKDASATAIYGSRGANGVVLITTKQGRLGQINVDLDMSYSLQSIRKKLELMNAKEYALFYNNQQLNDRGEAYFTQEQIDHFKEGTDWQDIVFRTAPLKNTSLSINGGNEKTRFAISGSLFDQEGIIQGSDYKRYSIHSNLGHDINKQFSISLSSAFSKVETNGKNSGGGSRGNTLISAIVSAPPTFSPYNEDGTYSKLSNAYPFVAPDVINPLNWIYEQTDRVKANMFLANAAIVYKPINELTVKISGGIENRDDRSDSYRTTLFENSNGIANIRTSQFTSLLSENTINYTKTFKQDHNLSLLAGFTYQDFLTTSLSGSGNGFLSDAYESYNLGAASTPGIPASGYTQTVLLSYLGRLNYSYKSKYLATISFRSDGSSKYSEGNKWGYFPSGALAWRISNEDFFRHQSIISDLKLRVSWGLTGSQAINAYATLNQLSSDKVVFNDALQTSFAPGTTLRGNLKWETTEQKDAGIDLGLFNNRLSFTIDYYKKNTKDLLNTVVLPSSLGYTNSIRNIGEVQNKGLEIGLNTNMVNRDFSWDLSANISFNRNKVIKLYNGEDILTGSVNVTIVNDATGILREGRPIGLFWGYVEEGYDEKGMVIYKDLNADDAINAEDKTYIGDPNPDFIYGINSITSYKNVELSIFIQGSYGNDLFNASSISNTLDYGFGLNMPREVYTNHWTPDNIHAKYPTISYNNNVRLSDRFVEDGSYLRLKNIQLAYNLPIKKHGINWLEKAQLYISGQNLLTITRYSWWDPEISSYGGSNTALGIDHSSYPIAKSFTLGARIQF